MVWEWSHTTEAYQNVEDNIKNKPREWLEVVWAEWVACEKPRPYTDGPYSTGAFNQRKYATALARAKQKATEYLQEFIWDRTQELRTCENGGFVAHCCPFACVPHMISFDMENDNEDE